MTKLTKPVSRETRLVVRNRPVIITVAPCGSQAEARVGLRLKGKRTQYVTTLLWLYMKMAENHGYKERVARKLARRFGVPWKQAKKKFEEENSI